MARLLNKCFPRARLGCLAESKENLKWGEKHKGNVSIWPQQLH